MSVRWNTFQKRTITEPLSHHKELKYLQRDHKCHTVPLFNQDGRTSLLAGKVVRSAINQCLEAAPTVSVFGVQKFVKSCGMSGNTRQRTNPNSYIPKFASSTWSMWNVGLVEQLTPLDYWGNSLKRVSNLQRSYWPQSKWFWITWWVPVSGISDCFLWSVQV